MAGRYFAADWWNPTSDVGHDVALDVEAISDNEIKVTIRGLDSVKGPGSFYLSGGAAREFGHALRDVSLSGMDDGS